MPSTYMLRKHLKERALMKTPEAKVRISSEIEAVKRAEKDMTSKFPKITIENFEHADRYHKERLRFWKSKL